MRNIDGSSYLKNPELDIVQTKTDKDAATARRSCCSPTRPAREPEPEAAAKKPKRRVASSGG